MDKDADWWAALSEAEKGREEEVTPPDLSELTDAELATLHEDEWWKQKEEDERQFYGRPK